VALRKSADQRSSVAVPPRVYPWSPFDSRSNTIGVLHPCYGSSHVIYGLDTKRFSHRTLCTMPLNVFDSASTFYAYTPVVLDLSTPLVHTWNSVPMNKDFIVSFELELPRYLGTPTPGQIRRGMAILSSRRCKAILALSEFAYNHAKRVFAERGIPDLVKKMSVFRGGFPDPLEKLRIEKNEQARVSFRDQALSGIMVGAALFRKGAMYAIRAFERLRASGLNVRLTLIGSFEASCYAFREDTPDAEEWQARARKHDWIRFEGSMPNAQVLKELSAHDICLYPSLDESLGWLTIEAGMLGKPVVGNRVCAFPEVISHMKTGWLIDLPLGQDGRWKGIGAGVEARRALLQAANHSIVGGIEDCVRHLYKRPELLAEWGRAGRELMMRLYSMESASLQIEQLYDRFIGGN
jgi:glycosyltransferase involved in cell wall biosynthesis